MAYGKNGRRKIFRQRFRQSHQRGDAPGGCSDGNNRYRHGQLALIEVNSPGYPIFVAFQSSAPSLNVESGDVAAAEQTPQHAELDRLADVPVEACCLRASPVLLLGPA